MIEWPTPRTVKELRGFLGLTGYYYKRSIKGYGVLAKALNELLRKDKFEWSDKASAILERLKIAMITTHVLALPDFFLEFVIETDVCGVGIGTFFSAGRPPLGIYE